MNKKAVLLWLIAILLLAACGGGDTAEPAAPSSENTTTTSTTEDTAGEESEEMEEPAATTEEESPSEDEESEESAPEDEPVSEEEPDDTSEEAPAGTTSSPFGDRPMSGVDPDTGLTVNPEAVRPGDTFIIRGEIISMNLTPTTSPEFLIQSPAGMNYRLRAQDLADTFFEDGDQLQPFQYQLGLLAQATATLAADAGPSDIPTSSDLVLVKSE